MWVSAQAAGPAKPNVRQEMDSDAILSPCPAQWLSSHTLTILRADRQGDVGTPASSSINWGREATARLSQGHTTKKSLSRDLTLILLLFP